MTLIAHERGGARVTEYILTLRCLDAPGITHATASGLLDVGANILEQSQFAHPEHRLLCVRTRFETDEESAAVVRDAISARVERFDPAIWLRPAGEHRRALLMVSKLDHCLVDLLYRWQIGELPVDIPLIVSNHPDLRALADRVAIPFVHIPVTKETKPEAEAELLELVAKHEIDVVVLARYMQVLSDDLCTKLSARVINIHHSFLPGFKGARPYHQAYDRGVKLIGATAHFVTSELDEGPIIEQDVQRVSHAQSAESLVEIGRDVERRVLSRAVRLWAEDRVFLTGTRTVVFA